MIAKKTPIIAPPLLFHLLQSEGMVWIDSLSARLNVEAKKVYREIERLEAAGCRIQFHPDRGVSLAGSSIHCWRDYMQWRRENTIVAVYRDVASTQDAARQLIERHGDKAHRALVAANSQTAGRGRLGRTWHDVPGKSVLFSTACILPDDASRQAAPTLDHLTFIAAVAVARAIEAVTQHRLRVQIKWPNDLLVDGRKIAGILVEAFTHRTPDGRDLTGAIIGVGINVHNKPEDLPADIREQMTLPMTSLAMCGLGVDRLLMLDAAATCLDAALGVRKPSRLLREWRDRCVQMARPAEFIHDGWHVRGMVVDLDPCEGLIVRTEEGELVHLPAATTTTV